MKRGRTILFLTALILTACNGSREDMLLGKWQATAILEEGDTIDMDLSEVSLRFDEDGTYQYTSTLNYKEDGYYFVEYQFLYTRDTLAGESEQKAVRISTLSQDSLVLDMEEGGKPRKLVLVRP